MKKIAVCDDDSLILSIMKEYLESVKSYFHIDFFSSGEELLASEKAYDVIFLDIDMKGISGIDTGRKIRTYSKKAKIIYVTAYEDFRDYAFSVHAFGYLIKPVTKEKIMEVLLEALDYAKEETSGPRLRFQTEEGFQELFVKDICYFEYQNRKVRIVTTKAIFHIHEAISALGDRVAEMGFASPHKSFVVNLAHVKAIQGYELVMTNEDRLPLSQKRSPQFRQILTRYLAQQI